MKSFPILILLAATLMSHAIAQAGPAANASFDACVRQAEARLDRQHRSTATFLSTADEAVLRHGKLAIERVDPGPQPEGAMLHHWRGRAFVPGATAADFEALIRDIDAYPRVFAPQIVRASLLTQQGDRIAASMRVAQRHVIPVVLDTAYDIALGRLDPQHGFVTSHSTRIAEIASPGTRRERTLTAAEEHGFLWRLDTWWSYEQRDSGLSIEIETVSLTRSIPAGLAWAVGPFVESVPRESIEFTLRSVVNALRK